MLSLEETGMDAYYKEKASRIAALYIWETLQPGSAEVWAGYGDLCFVTRLTAGSHDSQGHQNACNR